MRCTRCKKSTQKKKYLEIETIQSVLNYRKTKKDTVKINGWIYDIFEEYKGNFTNLVHISAGILVEFVVGAEDDERDLTVT